MRKEIRVLHVISNFGIGGAEVWIVALLRYFKLQAERFDVHVRSDVFITNGVKDRLDTEAESLGARLIYARYSRKTLPSFINAWRATLRDGQYSAIHDHQEFSAGWHFLFGHGLLPGVRIAHLHNPMTHQKSYGNSFLRKTTIGLGNRLVAKFATHILSTSRRLITEQGFDNLSTARHLPKLAVNCGFDPTRFNAERLTARQSVCEEFQLSQDSKLMLFVGRLDSHADDAKNQKNPSFCLEVARACALRSDRFACLIAGSGNAMRQVLEGRVREWGLEGRIQLLGSRSDVSRLMLGSDVMLFPSLAEGLGMVAVEAQAAGLPVVASDAVPRECVVVDGMVTFLPLTLGAEHWADVVLKTIDAPKPDHALANSAVENSTFAIANSARQLIEIYAGASSPFS